MPDGVRRPHRAADEERGPCQRPRVHR
jgi:hypothetical protein